MENIVDDFIANIEEIRKPNRKLKDTAQRIKNDKKKQIKKYHIYKTIQSYDALKELNVGLNYYNKYHSCSCYLCTAVDERKQRNIIESEILDLCSLGELSPRKSFTFYTEDYQDMLKDK